MLAEEEAVTEQLEQLTVTDQPATSDCPSIGLVLDLHYLEVLPAVLTLQYTVLTRCAGCTQAVLTHSLSSLSAHWHSRPLFGPQLPLVDSITLQIAAKEYSLRTQWDPLKLEEQLSHRLGGHITHRLLADPTGDTRRQGDSKRVSSAQYNVVQSEAGVFELSIGVVLNCHVSAALAPPTLATLTAAVRFSRSCRVGWVTTATLCTCPLTRQGPCDSRAPQML